MKAQQKERRKRAGEAEGKARAAFGVSVTALNQAKTAFSALVGRAGIDIADVSAAKRVQPVGPWGGGRHIRPPSQQLDCSIDW